MSTRTDVLAQRASEERQRLAEAYDTLEDEVSELTDWRAYVKREPMLAVGVAVVAGTLLGALTGSGARRSRPARRAPLLTSASSILRQNVPSGVLVKVATVMAEILAARALAAYGSKRRQRRQHSDPSVR